MKRVECAAVCHRCFAVAAADTGFIGVLDERIIPCSSAAKRMGTVIKLILESSNFLFFDHVLSRLP